jgi:precorrin-6A/cobalt-precorrin-6A reductase
MPDKTQSPMILILGGTADAMRIAAKVFARYGQSHTVMTSLAGRVKTPQNPIGEVRIGGFGGIDGLKAYLRTHNVVAVIDATHPFAAQMSRHASLACDAIGVKRVQVRRPEWPKVAGDNWIEVDTVPEAAALLPSLGKRAFLTVGLGELAPFRDMHEIWNLVRVVDEPAEPLLNGPHLTIAARGPFHEADERALMAEHEIDVVVTKHAGGDATYGKLAVARERNIPVVMVRRPPAEAGDTCAPDGVLNWLEHTLPHEVTP